MHLCVARQKILYQFLLPAGALLYDEMHRSLVVRVEAYCLPPVGWGVVHPS